MCIDINQNNYLREVMHIIYNSLMLKHVYYIIQVSNIVGEICKKNH